MCKDYTKFKRNVAIETGYVVSDNEKFSDIWDTQTVSGDRLDFFPAQAASIPDANYQSNPLPGPHAHTFLGALVSSASRQIITNAEAEAKGIIDALSNATVTITADSDNKQLAQFPLKRIMNLDDAHIEHSVMGDGTTDRFDVHLPPGSVEALPNPIRIAQNQVFNVRIEFKDASAVPADTLKLQLELSRVVPKQS